MPLALNLRYWYSKGNSGWYTPCLKSPSQTKLVYSRFNAPHPDIMIIIMFFPPSGAAMWRQFSSSTRTCSESSPYSRRRPRRVAAFRPRSRRPTISYNTVGPPTTRLRPCGTNYTASIFCEFPFDATAVPFNSTAKKCMLSSSWKGNV
jgi:hypothetical protein